MNIVKDLIFCKPKFVFVPLDIIAAGSPIDYEVPCKVKVDALYPRMYTIVNKDERVFDLIVRNGGLTALAYVKRSSLKCEGHSTTSGKNSISQAEEEQNKLAKFQRLQGKVNHSIDIAQQQKILKNVYLWIKPEKILENTASQADLTLKGGDIIRILKQLQSFKINGEFLYPATTIFNKNRKFKYSISQGSGFSNKSFKRCSYVIYANGTVKSTSKTFFFNNYPYIEPAAEVFVPKKDTIRICTGIVGYYYGYSIAGSIYFRSFKFVIPIKHLHC